MKSEERGSSLLRWLDFWCGIPMTLPAALYRRLFHPAAPPAEPASIGIICLGAIGDLLLVSGLTSGIRKLFPSARIELIASDANSSALSLNPHVDAVFSAPIRNVWRLVCHLRKQKFDVLIDASQWARLGNLLCNLSAAGRTAGFETVGQYRAAGYDAVCRHRNDCHELENFLGLGRVLWPELTGEPSIKKDDGHVSEKSGKVVYCHFWAARGKIRHFKEWPEEYWASLIRFLLDAGCQVRLTGATCDQAGCSDFLAKYFCSEARVESVAGKVTLARLASLFADAAAVISVNTGIMHLAALAGAPTVGLHGATNPRRWGPVGENTVSLLPRSGACAYLNLGFEQPDNVKPAMENLPVSDVLAALRSLGVIV